MGTTVGDLRLKSTDLVATSYPILEPLNAPSIFGNKLDRFGDIYSLSNNSHLYRLLVALGGDSGAGQLKKDMLLPRLEQQLEATHFGNLDRLYGNPLALPRLSEEIYNYHPETDFLTSGQWDEVLAKDASYRARCLIWMRALIAGPTPLGLSLAGEAAIGIECDIWERYQYIQFPGGNVSPDYSATNAPNEFVLIPRLPSTELKQKHIRAIKRLTDMLKPVNSICTVWLDSGNYGRLKSLALTTSSTSAWSNVQRLVTGRGDVVWPDIDISQGLWIDTAEREAPTMAFMNSQESVTYLTITSATASSYQVGFFNQPQRALFSHLTDANGDFPPNSSYNTSIAPVNVSTGWTGNGVTGSNIVVNNSYPIGYFATIDSNIVSAPTNSFWASLEQPAPEVDWIIFELSRLRPINYIYFEVSQKPFDWTIEWRDGNGNWSDITLREDYPASMSMSYLPSNSNPWNEFNVFFQTVQADAIRITFTRRDDPFPLANSDPFEFSIELRDVHLMHTIPTATEFIEDTGVDILGNQFRTAIQTYDSDNTLNGGSAPWYSQPNPSKFAVEALYFQLDGSVIDEIYVDPITYGCDMHFYYSEDEEETDWDNKLWVPIPRNYILKRGYHALPNPISPPFFKIEFSNLTAIPYEPVQFPKMPPVTYRRYPLWINNFFNSLQPIAVKDALSQSDPITIDPLTFGFVQVKDHLVSSYEAERIKQVTSTEPELKTYIDKIVNKTDTISEPQAALENTIEYHSVMQWQTNLIANLDANRALSRVALEPHLNVSSDTGWASEMGLPAITPPVYASSDDMSISLREKLYPIMFFSRRCRHQYQIVRAPIDRKIAYVVGVNEVGFYRRGTTFRQDDRLYIETLDDTAFAEVNDFIQNDWRWTVD